MKILEFHTTEDQVRRAKEVAASFPLNNRSYMRGKRNEHAFLGEIVVGDYLGCELHPDRNVWDYDLIFKEKKWDIKTKMTTVRPKANYNCTIYTYFNQKCDGYIFTRCLRDLSKVWMVGWIYKKDLLEKGKKFKKGDLDDNLIMEREGIGIKIKELNAFENVSNYSKS